MKSEMKKQDIFGLSAALITPFRADGSVDLPRLLRHANHVLDQGCDTITLFGTTGEGFSIGMRERAAMIGAVLAGGVEANKLNAGVTATTVADAVEQSRLALDFGASGLLLAPPFYFKGPDEDGLFSWFSDVIEGIGGDARGVILYHIPGQTAVPLSVDLVDRLKQAFPGVITGVKDFVGRQGDGGSIPCRAWRTGHPSRRRAAAWPAPCARAPRARSAVWPTSRHGCSVMSSTRPGTTRSSFRLVDLIVSYPVMPAVKALVAHIHDDDEYLRMRAPLVDLPAKDRAALVSAYEAILAPGQDRKSA